jgi:flagellar hook-associated protein 2
VTQLVEVEKQPLKTLQTKAAKLETQLSAFATVKSQLASLGDAASDLLSTDTWGAKTFSSSDTTAVTGTASSSSIASSFSMSVTQLASSQSARSAAMTSTDTVNAAGTLSISIGIWTSGYTDVNNDGDQEDFLDSNGDGVDDTGESTHLNHSFEATLDSDEDGDVDDPLEVEIVSTDTLSSVASKINAKDAGVTAVVVTSGTQQRLLIRSSNTGADYGFEIKAYDVSGAEITDGSTGVGKFSYIAAPSGTSGLTQTQAGQDASITVEDITITSSSNTVSDAVPGVTLKLLSTTSSAVQITVGNDTDTIKTKITAFQDAYNTLVSNLKTLTKYDATTKKAGDLQGDGTAVTLLSVLNSMVSATGPADSKTFSYLSDVGIQVQPSGLLSTNSSTLTTAFDSLDDLKTFFYNYGSTTANNGLARRFRDFEWDANGVQGTLSLKKTALSDAITRNESSQEKFNVRIAEVQKRLYKQYGGLDSRMGGLNGLGSFMSAQVAQWNKN